jgi:prepilin-type N-terminal cleavage/methylation domain-containing protein
MNRARKKRGFTLIELLIVMVIMAILTIIITGTFASSIQRGRDARRKDDLRSLSGALEGYFNDKGKYPIGVNGIMMGCSTLDSQPCNWGGQFTDSKGTLYMVLIPSDPSKYTYYYVSNGLKYQLYAKLENTLDAGNGVVQGGYANTNCGTTSTVLCTYGISSSNTSPTAQ